MEEMDLKPRFFERLLKTMKKTSKATGLIACTLTMIAYLVLLLIGTGIIRTEFNFVIHALIPAIISRLVVFVWVFYYAFTDEYDLSTRIFARNLLIFIVANIIITFLDYEMIFFFLVQSITSMLLLILTTLLISQRRFAIRSKKYANYLRVINTILAMCMGGFVILIATSFMVEYIYLFVATVVSQIFMMVAIWAADDVENKFQQALIAGANDAKEEEYSD